MSAQEKSLEQLELEKEKREEQRRAEAKERRRQALLLEERYEAELGARGQDFEIVETIAGPIVIRRGESVLFKKFMAAYNGGKDPSIEDLHAYVTPCVEHPEREEFLKIVAKHPGIYRACANALADLHVGKERDTKGKY